MKISIVCASHKGRNRIPKLINSINENSFKPYEIILCVTDRNDIELISKDIIKKLNIKIIISTIKNQSKQRKLAIESSSGDYILQFDDDLVFDQNVLEKFKLHFKDNKHENKIVSALVVLPNKTYQSSRWNNIYKSSPIFRFILFYLNGFRKIKPMSILKSGRVAPLIIFDKKNNLIENAEWLNSCVMYNKKAIIHSGIEEFDFKKSYFEDVFFSHNLYLKKYKLILDKNIQVHHHFVEPTNLFTFFKTIYVQYRIVKKYKKNYFLFISDIFIFSFLYIISTIINLIKKNK